MKLFSAKDALAKKQDQMQATRHELSHMSGLVIQETQKLNDLRVETQKATEKFKELQSQLVGGLEQKVDELKNEVLILEERKRAALEPIDKKLSELATRQQALEDLRKEYLEDEERLQVRETQIQNEVRALESVRMAMKSWERELKDKQAFHDASKKSLEKEWNRLEEDKESLRIARQENDKEILEKLRDIENKDKIVQIGMQYLEEHRTKIEKEFTEAKKYKMKAKKQFETYGKPRRK